MKITLIIFILGFSLTSNAQFTATTLSSDPVTKTLSVFAQDNSGNTILPLKRVEVMNNLGQVISDAEPVISQVDIDLPEPGVYFIRVTTPAGVVTKKILCMP